MPRTTLPLTDSAVKNVKPKLKLFYLCDGGGLMCAVTPNGCKTWLQKYRLHGKEYRMKIGSYPALSLLQAREERLIIQKLVAQGIDPAKQRAAEKEIEAASTLEAVAREWHSTMKSAWSATYARATLVRLEMYVFPALGYKHVAEITPAEIFRVLQITSKTASATAKTIRAVLGAVYRFAIGTGKAVNDPTTASAGLLPPRLSTHYAALTKPAEVKELLQAIDRASSSLSVKTAMLFAAWTFQRPMEVLKAEWKEIDLEKGEWNLPIEKMKMKTTTKSKRKGETHLVPLATQTIKALKELYMLTGSRQYVFTSPVNSNAHLSKSSITTALARMGFSNMTMHGFRAMARTLLDEELEFPVDIIEAQLAHSVKDPLGRAYNRTTKIRQRKEMMQVWADYLDELRGK